MRKKRFLEELERFEISKEDSGYPDYNPLIILPLMTFGDYCGGTAERSNNRVFIKWYGRLGWVTQKFYGYGGCSIALSINDIITELDDGQPIIADILRELDADKQEEVLYQAMEKSNTYGQMETAVSCYLDLERIIPALLDLETFSAEQQSALLNQTLDNARYNIDRLETYTRSLGMTVVATDLEEIISDLEEIKFTDPDVDLERLERWNEGKATKRNMWGAS